MAEEAKEEQPEKKENLRKDADSVILTSEEAGPSTKYQRNQHQQAEEGYVRVKLPNKKKGEIFAIADQLLGGSRIKCVCADGKGRLARIPGKLRRRMWIREGDLLIISPWEFQDEKADIKWRYTKTQAVSLSKKGLIPKEIDIY